MAIRNKVRAATPDADNDDRVATEASATQSDDVDAEPTNTHEAKDDDATTAPWLATPLALLVINVVIVAVLAGLSGWLGFRAFQSHQTAQQRALYIQVARQAAVNLTTIDWHHPEEDVQRIISSATGSFHDDFSKRSQTFVEVVKEAQSKSEGTVVSSGLESVGDNSAQVLIAMSVATTSAASQDQTPRAWRMRIDVQKVGNDVKVSKVEFVP